MKTKKEILQEVVNHIENQGRAIDGTDCVYQTDEGKTCGHSFALTDEAREEVASWGFYTCAKDVIDILNDSCHKEDYRGHSTEFWMAVQTLHDLEIYWSKKESGVSLTELGKKEVTKILNNN